MDYKSLEEGFVTLSKLGKALKVAVRHSLKAKRVSIRIGLKGAELILPYRNPSHKLAYKFLLTKESWVRQKLDHVEKQSPIDNSTLLFNGKIYSLRYLDTNHVNVEINEEDILVYAPAYQHEYILKRYLKNILLKKIIELTTYYNKKYNLPFASIKIMNNKSKWGSCTSKAVLSFHWRLVFAPHEVLQYLVVHEMCHLIEMNHSSNFWKTVELIYPNYFGPKLWLKDNCHRLHQYLPAKTVSENKHNIHSLLQLELLQGYQSG